MKSSLQKNAQYNKMSKKHVNVHLYNNFEKEQIQRNLAASLLAMCHNVMLFWVSWALLSMSSTRYEPTHILLLNLLSCRRWNVYV